MKNAIIVHGKPSKEEYYDPKLPSSSNFAWIPWLQKQLLVQDILTQTPEMPRAYEPNYQAWCREFERFDITPETTLVGHSAGGGFLVRWLSAHPEVMVGKVVLVAPSLGLNWDDKTFFDFEIDPGLEARCQQITIYGSDDDKSATKEAIQKYRDAIQNLNYVEFHGYGHFTQQSMGRADFPELLQEILA